MRSGVYGLGWRGRSEKKFAAKMGSSILFCLHKLSGRWNYLQALECGAAYSEFVTNFLALVK